MTPRRIKINQQLFYSSLSNPSHPQPLGAHVPCQPQARAEQADSLVDRWQYLNADKEGFAGGNGLLEPVFLLSFASRQLSGAPNWPQLAQLSLFQLPVIRVEQ